MTDSALIVFLRKPEISKVKTRLARKIGDEKAMAIYNILVEKTYQESKNLNVDVLPFYTPEIPDSIPWINANSQIQKGDDLGECMRNAFEYVFAQGYKKAVIIGSDCFSLRHDILEKAFEELNENDFIIGPSEDGGYYLLGMKENNPDIFENIAWSREDVYAKTIEKIKGQKVKILDKLNDIDTFEDLQKEPALLNRVI
ncbi:TIGR04282 family arsenosugar biosynthesis glycosyltransferase [Hyphobacterium sp. CCMP332]|nr:TIGR04282 family arsenosugar biosynthesis glycosyltransferase [Hyphobacterium sp. CCMP332]